LPPSSAENSRQLDTSVGASGPHDFAVRLSAVRQRHRHVHHIPPRVRDDRDTPLLRDGTAADIEVIWVRREQEYFCERGWTEDAPNSPSGKSTEWVGFRNYERCATSRWIITTVARMSQRVRAKRCRFNGSRRRRAAVQAKNDASRA
jgi:hypothetical protein